MVMVHGCKFFQDLLKAHVFLEHVLQTRTCYRLDSLKLLNFIDWFVVFQVCLLAEVCCCFAFLFFLLMLLINTGKGPGLI